MPIPGPVDAPPPLEHRQSGVGRSWDRWAWCAALARGSFIFSKGLERASAQAFFRLYKRVGPEDTSRQANFLIDSEPGIC